MPLRDNPSRSRSAFGSRVAFMVGGPIRPATIGGVALQRPPQPKHRLPLPLQPPAHHWSLASSSRRITDTGPSYLKFGAFDLPRRRGATTSPLTTVVVSVRAAAMDVMKPSPTDIDPLPHRWRNLLPLTG